MLTQNNIAAALQFAPQPSLLEFVAYLKQVLDNATALGITTLFDAGLGATDLPLVEIGLLKLAAHLGPVRIAAALFTHCGRLPRLLFEAWSDEFVWFAEPTVQR